MIWDFVFYWWTYIRENMNTDNPVAYYVNQNGYTVFMWCVPEMDTSLQM